MFVCLVCRGYVEMVSLLLEFGADVNATNAQVWYGIVWYGMVWYGMVWYGMVWYMVCYFMA